MLYTCRRSTAISTSWNRHWHLCVCLFCIPDSLYSPLEMLHPGFWCLGSVYRIRNLGLTALSSHPLSVHPSIPPSIPPRSQIQIQGACLWYTGSSLLLTCFLQQCCLYSLLISSRLSGAARHRATFVLMLTRIPPGSQQGHREVKWSEDLRRFRAACCPCHEKSLVFYYGTWTWLWGQL